MGKGDEEAVSEVAARGQVLVRQEVGEHVGRRLEGCRQMVKGGREKERGWEQG